MDWKSIRRRSSCVAAVAFSAACAGSAERAPRGDSARAVGATSIVVARPTVIAYFLIAPGAVDTSRDLAVEADDWNVAMAALRDRLGASGVDLVMITEPTVRLAIPGGRDTVLALGPAGAGGYVYVRPGARPCVRPGGADADSVAARAQALAAGTPPCT